MPMYQWKCTKCEAGVEVLRNISAFDQVPEGDELPPATEPPCEHQWKKQIGKTSFKLHGFGWSNTGYWNGK